MESQPGIMRTAPYQAQGGLSRRWRSPITLGDLSALIIISVLLTMPALALTAAGWSVELRTIIPVTLIGVGFGFVLARSQFSEITALIVSLMYGIGAVIFAAAIHQQTVFIDGVAEVLRRTWDWTVALFTGGINTDDLVFTMLVAMLFWFLAYSAGWHLFRLDRVWRVILPPGLILLVNAVIYSGSESLDIYLVFFLMMSLLLIVRSNLDARQWDWYVSGVQAPSAVRRQAAAIGAALSILALTIAWSIPTDHLQERLDAFQRFLASDPIQQISEVWSRLFTPIEGEGPATTDYYGGDLLNLGGAVRLGDEVVLLVDAPRSKHRYYWRSRVYERYADGQWSPSADLRITDQSAPLELSMNAEVIGQKRETVNQVFTVGAANSRLYYAAPQPGFIAGAGRIDLIYTDKPNNSSMNVSVIRPLKVLKRGETYHVSSLTSAATAADLRSAGSAYPEWVSNPNLYVGQSNGRVLNLAQQIVSEAGAGNPYDQAKAIEQWLRGSITYSETISAPPPGVDPVEWVLFDVRQGYCTYYATAMIVMLRHLGIPARLAAGFSQGEVDAASGQYVVRERDAHTWVEVYFPGYGWIEFEPTTAEEPYNRDGDSQASAQPPLSSQPTSSPTPSPSPTPVPSPTSPATQAAPEENPPLPTMTATPSPTPTATAVIVPTTAPPIAPDEPTPFFQPLVLMALSISLLLIVLALMLAFLVWWWEWRGMSGLSPVSRAYARLERYIQLIGIRVGSNKTTLEKRSELQKRIPAAKEPIRAISDLYTLERYRGGGKDPSEPARHAETAEKAWYRTRGKIIRRWLRRLMPRLGKD